MQKATSRRCGPLASVGQPDRQVIAAELERLLDDCFGQSEAIAVIGGRRAQIEQVLDLEEIVFMRQLPIADQRKSPLLSCVRIGGNEQDVVVKLGKFA
jgi:hypothetical protein